MNETPITPENIDHFVDGIPDYELGRILWREIQSYYDPLKGDENSAVEHYASFWGLDYEELRRVIGGRSLAGSEMVHRLGLTVRRGDGKCNNCNQATTFIHYFLAEKPVFSERPFPHVWLDD